MGETPADLICSSHVLASPLPLENWVSYPILPVSTLGKKRPKEAKLLIGESAASEAPWFRWPILPIVLPIEY